MTKPKLRKPLRCRSKCICGGRCKIYGPGVGRPKHKLHRCARCPIIWRYKRPAMSKREWEKG